MNKFYFIALLLIVTFWFVSCNSLKNEEAMKEDNLSITPCTQTVTPSIAPQPTTFTEIKDNNIDESENTNIDEKLKNTFTKAELPIFDYGVFMEWKATDTMDFFFYADVSVEEIRDYIEQSKESGFNQKSLIDEYESNSKIEFKGENKDNLIVLIRLMEGEARIAIGIEDDVHLD